MTVAALSSRRVDGLIILPVSDDQTYLRAEQSAGLPMVFVDRPAGGSTRTPCSQTTPVAPWPGPRTCSARSPPGRRGRPEGRSVHDGGAGRGLPVSAEHGVAERRESGAAGLRDARGLPEGGRRAARPAGAADGDLRAEQPVHDRRGAGAPHGREAHTIALIGFDDFEPADLLDPPLSVIAQDLDKMGETAARWLFHRLNGEDCPVQRILVPTTLIARGSGENPFSPSARATAPHRWSTAQTASSRLSEDACRVPPSGVSTTAWTP